ncbi:hypothetical protein SH668x_002627 [Planctomicrobium sp. SH668]|uniref:hypothetical protein n=1 Tax=Planctomicrobium sp. SH668 TaxID=3448126 RepID=UPI003F5B746C
MNFMIAGAKTRARALHHRQSFFWKQLLSPCESLASMPPPTHISSAPEVHAGTILVHLILRADLNVTYRGDIEVVDVSDSVRDRLWQTTLPQYSMLEKVWRRQRTKLSRDLA